MSKRPPFRKAGGADPLHMISGSAEFGQVVRSAIGFAHDTDADDGTCVLSLIKTNIAPQGLTSILYRIEPAVVDTPEGPTDVGRFVPLGDTTQTIGELLNHAPETSEERSEKSEAVEWLRAYLTAGNRGGEAEAGEVLKAAERDGFRRHIIQRARAKAGVTTRKGDTAWLWSYSPTAEQDDTRIQDDNRENAVNCEDDKVTRSALEASSSSSCHLVPSASPQASSVRLRSVTEDPGCDQYGATPSAISGSKRLCADHAPDRHAA
ncbi:hypothetical protein [Saccharopolyspora pogona]|uniref:hypothetical protein n=1 Tax=Saccharopolyspora pogona TaxID=333966 RepID=UPI001CC25CC5|nr:hypothetical protein [Saccharopolyspora pogona]